VQAVWRKDKAKLGRAITTQHYFACEDLKKSGFAGELTIQTIGSLLQAGLMHNDSRNHRIQEFPMMG
jgi:hypothetical protein